MPSEKTVERLTVYRYLLRGLQNEGERNVFSHRLAALAAVKASQVRHDMMAIGYSGSPSQGYSVGELLDSISEFLDTPLGKSIVLVGVGNLGRAITTYFVGKRSKLNIIATFDVDTSKIDRRISGVKCYSLDRLKEVVEANNISIAIMTVPADSAVEVSEQLEEAGIKGVLNFTTIPLNSPTIYLDEYDMITSLEKVAYFVKMAKQ